MGATAVQPKAFYSIQELAVRWVVSTKTIKREIERGRLKRKYLGGQLRFEAEEVARYEREA